jgi:hypothetical protein
MALDGGRQDVCQLRQCGPIQLDSSLLDAASQEQTVRLWLTQMCVDSGYQNVDHELARHVLI